MTSNPKDRIGATKLPLTLVPDTLSVFAAMAFAEGASKYGAYNWRIGGARASIYIDAMRRHVAKWWNGEDIDPETGIPHLASAVACLSIILDAEYVLRAAIPVDPGQTAEQVADQITASLFELGAADTGSK